jgi:GR25 family glycosyltransferase involved in LPS biosynthesis
MILIFNTQENDFTWDLNMELESNKIGNYDIDFVAISLPTRKKSHFNVLRNDLQKYDISISCFEAFNGKLLKYEDYYLAPRYIQFFENNKKEREAGKTKTDYRGHFGCAISHLTILKSVRGTTCIMEDDADIVPNFKMKLESCLQILDELDSTWELLVLGFSCRYSDHFYHKLNDYEPIYKNTIVKLHYWIGGWSWIVKNKEVAEKMLTFFNPINWHVDITIAEQARLGNLNVYGCQESISRHPGLLRASSWDFNQVGNVNKIRTDTNA